MTNESQGSATPTGPASTPPSVWNLPNALTLARIAMAPVCVVLLWNDTLATRLLAVVVFLVAAATDRLDGQIARSRGLVTDFGKIADPFADKALTLGVLLTLSAMGEVPWWISVVIVVRELGITLLRFALARREVIPASAGGKLKTVLQIVALAILIAPWSPLLPDLLASIVVGIGIAVLIAALLVTVATGVDYVRRAVQILRAT